MIEVSVIIPVYNRTQYLPACLDSLENQTLKNMEVILVDDGSTERSNIKDQISKFENLKNKIIMIKQKHSGAGAARNLGASHARGEILVFVDCDMYFEKDFLVQLIDPIRSGKAKGTFSKNEYVANWTNAWARCWNYYYGLKDRRKIPVDFPDLSPVFRAIKKSEFIKSGGFKSTGYNDDWTVSEKLGYKASLAKGAVYYHFNPENLLFAYFQSKWRSKREYKFGIPGVLGQLVLHSLPVSLIKGIIGSISCREPALLLFTLVADFGNITGIIEKNILLNNY